MIAHHLENKDHERNHIVEDKLLEGDQNQEVDVDETIDNGHSKFCIGVLVLEVELFQLLIDFLERVVVWSHLQRTSLIHLLGILDDRWWQRASERIIDLGDEGKCCIRLDNHLESWLLREREDQRKNRYNK